MQLLSIPWLETRAIDLRPCLPSIQKQDFLSLQPRPHYQVVVCSMVLNCIPTGEHWADAWLHILPGGSRAMQMVKALPPCSYCQICRVQHEFWIVCPQVKHQASC